MKLLQAAQDCKFEILNEHFRDRFIVSVGDKKIQTKLLAMSDDVTFAEAMKVDLAMSLLPRMQRTSRLMQRLSHPGQVL